MVEKRWKQRGSLGMCVEICEGRSEAMHHVVTVLTKTKRVNRVKKDDRGQHRVRRKLVARGLTPRHEDPCDDLHAAIPSVEGNEALFADVAGVRKHQKRARRPRIVIHVRGRGEGTHQCSTRRGKTGCTYQNKFTHIEEMLVRFKQSPYGMRKAARGREDNCARKFV